jgi:hypothetical protein
MSFIKKNEDVCGLKTVYTPCGLQGPAGSMGPVGLIDYTIVHPRTFLTQNEIQGLDEKKKTDTFPIEIDRLGFLEAVEVTIETAPAGSVGFLFARYNGTGVYIGSTGSVTILAGNSSAFVYQFGFIWTTLGTGQHSVVLRFKADPVAGIADKLLTVYLNIT